LVAPHLTPDADYPAAVRRSRPWGYWRFESQADGTFPNEVPGRPPLSVIGPIRTGGVPGGNHYALFSADGGQQYLEMASTWHPTWRPGFAVELWCLSETIRHATAVSMPHEDDTNNHL